MYKQIFYPITVTLLLNLTLTQNLLGFQGYRGLSIHIMHKLYLYILTYNFNIPQTKPKLFSSCGPKNGPIRSKMTVSKSTKQTDKAKYTPTLLNLNVLHCIQ